MDNQTRIGVFAGRGPRQPETAKGMFSQGGHMADQSQNAEIQRRQAEAWKSISTYHSVCTMYKPDDPATCRM